jgi:AraC-like DNA-binding protein
MNFNQWLNHVRIHEAKKMFVDEKFAHYSIEGISQEVGFSSISSFNMAFKKETGLTPSVFRKSVLQASY